MPDTVWAQTSWQITARREIDPSGRVNLVRRCAVTNSETEKTTQSAHVVRARRGQWGVSAVVFHGQADVRLSLALSVASALTTACTHFATQIDLLRQAQVVPDYAHINAQANRIQRA